MNGLNTENEIINELVSELKQRKVNIIKLALCILKYEISVWAIINDDDEKSEDDLLMSIAKINSKYYEQGFYVSINILENSDKINIPEQYKIINTNE